MTSDGTCLPEESVIKEKLVTSRARNSGREWPGQDRREDGRERKTAQQTKSALAAASTSAPSDPAVNNAVGLETPPPS